VAPDGEANNPDRQDGEKTVRRGQGLNGRFRVENGETVAEGRGEVLFAFDEELGRRVVLKRTDPGEARAFAKFGHRHVVTVYDVLTIRRGPRAGTWLVMEHIPNGSLSGRTFTHREAARIGAQIANALTALHHKGLVHCDVKPANIVFASDDVAKLTDFDAARRLAGMETISPDRPISYTPDYAAPELVGGNPQTASDVFSLGATLYALTAGIPPRPWSHSDPAGEADDRGPGDGGSGNELRPGSWARRSAVEMTADVGPLRPVLTAMLQAEPGNRPTAAEAYRLLSRLAEPPMLGQRARDTLARRWPAAAVATGAVAVATIALVVFWPSGHGEPAATPTEASSKAAAGPGGTRAEPKIVASKGPKTTYGKYCRDNCAFIEFRATGLEPNTEYHFQPYTTRWDAFNPGAHFSTDAKGAFSTDSRFPCAAVGQRVWIVAKGPDGQRIVSNKVAWTAG
jgi:eukaryotic-like serine/threonine-protein kinase